MAAVDEKMAALAFTATTSRTPEQVVRLLDDAAEVSRGGFVLARSGAGRVDGRVRNVLRVTHAEFTVHLEQQDDGQTTVRLSIGDYLRTRDTVLLFIPLSPWSAPAYKPLREFVEYLRSKL